MPLLKIHRKNLFQAIVLLINHFVPKKNEQELNHNIIKMQINNAAKIIYAKENHTNTGIEREREKKKIISFVLLKKSFKLNVT